MSYLNSQNSLELLLCHFGIAQVTAKKLSKQQKQLTMYIGELTIIEVFNV